MGNRQKLELTWIGKENRPRLEPRILLEDLDHSYHAEAHVTKGDLFDNRLIFGDNLLALKALEQEFTGRIKSIYIDPPFNTGQALTNYEDGLEHSIWLSLMRDRIEILRRLLTLDGSIFVHIDDNELGYLIVLMDEIFGRDNRVSVITFKQGSATGHKSINPGCVSTSNFILIYARDKESWDCNRVYTARDRDTRYTQFIVNRHEDYYLWKFTSLAKAVAASLGLADREARRMPGYQEKVDDFVLANSDSVIRLAQPSYDGVSAAARELIDQSRIRATEIMRLEREGHPDLYLTGGQRILFYSDKLKMIDGSYVSGEPLTTIWDDLLSNNLHNEGGVNFPKGKKPEALIKRLLELSTREGDWVLDSFGGSGTTGAVAHKMGRRWIMVELGEHCHTHIIPRLRKVIDGSDQSGISKAVGWKGGGGYRYFYIAPSLLQRDRWGNLIINRDYNPEMLAEAVCKHMGFTYVPSETDFWQHGRREDDFIYVTTQTLTHEQLAHLSEEVGMGRTLLVCCAAFQSKSNGFENLTIKKIPNAVLNRCEWGRDDYSLNVASLPAAPPGDADDLAGEGVAGNDRSKRPARKVVAVEPTLPLEVEGDA